MEKPNLVMQLGSADPDLALAAALTVLPDVSGFDLNCGCPKKFSLQGGMGAALLKEPAKIEAILGKLIAGLPPSVPVTAKIRVFDDLEATLSLVRRLAATGIRALTVHARTSVERPRHPARWEYFPLIAEAIAPLPLIANGDFLDHDRVHVSGRQIRGVSSWMLARGAQWNVSVFRREGPLPLRQVCEAYLRKSLELGMPATNVKYTLLQMWMGAQEMESEPGAKEMVKRMQLAKCYNTLASALDVDLPSTPVAEDGLIEADTE